MQWHGLKCPVCLKEKCTCRFRPLSNVTCFGCRKPLASCTCVK